MNYGKMNNYLRGKVIHWVETGKNEKVNCIIRLSRNDEKELEMLKEKTNTGKVTALIVTIYETPVSKIAEISDFNFVDFIELPWPKRFL